MFDEPSRSLRRILYISCRKHWQRSREDSAPLKGRPKCRALTDMDSEGPPSTKFLMHNDFRIEDWRVERG